MGPETWGKGPVTTLHPTRCDSALSWAVLPSISPKQDCLPNDGENLCDSMENGCKRLTFLWGLQNRPLGTEPLPLPKATASRKPT